MLIFIVWLLDEYLDAVGVYTVEATNQVAAAFIGERLADIHALDYEWATSEPATAADLAAGIVLDGSERNGDEPTCLDLNYEFEDIDFERQYHQWYEAGMPLS